MIEKDFVSNVCEYTQSKNSAYSVKKTEIDGLTALCATKSTKLEATIYNPILCLILQGEKETRLGNKDFRLQAGDSLIVSHDLPVSSRIVTASDEKPYAALVLSVDMNIIRSLYDEVGQANITEARANAMSAGTSEHELVQAMRRLFELNSRQNEVKVMEPLIRREIHFRMLLARHGGMLRQLLEHNSAPTRIAKAIGVLRQSYKNSISIPELAEAAGMSPSSFHAHFKATTTTTPLQYQKELRLLEARRLLIDERRSVSAAAFEVGYESPTQFSREYSRKFGIAPRNDLARDMVSA